MQPESLSVARPAGLAVWACPFRPFFLAAAAYAVLSLVGWLGVLLSGWPLAGGYTPMQWHSHEMLFGMVAAAVAGFLLTAMCNWTGATPLSGSKLQMLFGLWLAGRIGMWLSNWVPLELVALIDLTFLAAVAVYAGRVIIGSGNYRNLPLVAVVSVLWLTNLLFHAGAWSGDTGLVRRAELGTILLIVMLIVIIGGRIIPAFTRNWLMRHQKDPKPVKTRAWVEVASITSTALLALLLLAGAPSPIIAGMAALAGLANVIRLLAWSGWLAHQDPLVWILHVGYAWVPLGLLLMAVSHGGFDVAGTAWLHALGPGAMAVMIVGVMTRVALGHTGRSLELPPGAVASYVLILVAALVRLTTALGWVPWKFGVMTTTVTWVAAFVIFLWLYLPILIRPRVDGQPG
ncbi:MULTISPECIES: NnrS family protein [unclassified Wenzhouxiangella]|uniref:NnrS family protein n=1 Tax=unclassified Wenzhouxiangella TaxID=2613841 RepID=UPI000E32A6C5|nr:MULTISPECIES: NnrS family protein [unclassified Wenzhouxiangella]RFF27219.1 NnrS family protein [Wenzhouxiangella sp. 15181]RFP69095.1 NnrS family protein [Wenzhouxiangella sp. 15190]